ncbi:SLATT domain-containing protein [Raoultella planticola]|uniref:SLATT domain-containing protein n=1 Tax=Raoultella planticola TaxID=575 RepID=UPI003A4E4293
MCKDIILSGNYWQRFKDGGYSFLSWTFSRAPIERENINANDKLINSMRITSKCRFNAANRLSLRSKTSFFVTTMLSLGLILIPLLQNSGVNLSFTSSVLNMLQIFLAVSVLIYSVTIGTARYDLRSRELDDCGKKIKELIRKIRTHEGSGNNDISPIVNEYNQTLKESEGHSRADYQLARLEMRSDYNITGLLRVWHYSGYVVSYIFPYLLPFLFLASELIFITDMLNITHVLTPYLLVK